MTNAQWIISIGKKFSDIKYARNLKDGSYRIYLWPQTDRPIGIIKDKSVLDWLDEEYIEYNCYHLTDSERDFLFKLGEMFTPGDGTRGFYIHRSPGSNKRALQVYASDGEMLAEIKIPEDSFKDIPMNTSFTEEQAGIRKKCKLNDCRVGKYDS